MDVSYICSTWQQKVSVGSYQVDEQKHKLHKGRLGRKHEPCAGCSLNPTRIRVKPLTLWRCDVCSVQRVYDAGIIFTERQMFYQMGHVYLQDDRSKETQWLITYDYTYCVYLTVTGFYRLIKTKLAKKVTYIIQAVTLQVMNCKQNIILFIFTEDDGTGLYVMLQFKLVC